MFRKHKIFTIQQPEKYLWTLHAKEKCAGLLELIVKK